VVLVQNPETAALTRDSSRTQILPNSTALITDAPPTISPRNREILVVGRLIPWKGGALAVRAMLHVTAPGASLHFLGGGGDLTHLQRLVARWGLAERVRFEGGLPRQAALERVARAGVLLHPALHDESPVAVGEALSLGTPVVCLDRGGPPQLLRRWPTSPGKAVAPQGVDATARHLAEAVDEFLLAAPATVTAARRPTPSYVRTILSAYELAAGETIDRSG
jgi:glycosyltransferase involved in cell wall biosynthesis